VTDAEGIAAQFFGDDRVVFEFDFRVEPAGEHALVILHGLRVDPGPAELEARKLGDIRIGLRIEPGAHQIDELNAPLLSRLRLEQLLLSRRHRPIGQLSLHDFEAFLDLFFVDAGAVPTEKKLDDVGRHGKLVLESPHQILAHNVPFERLGGGSINRIQFHNVVFTHGRPPWLDACE
jgi:hypothetical protein